MKKLFALLLVSMFVSLLAACGDTPTEEEPLENTEQVELTREDEIKNIITAKVADDYRTTSITDIRVNEDLGTGEGYIVLVDLSFDAKNRAGTAKDMIDMYAGDLAATLAGEEDLNEVVSFWQVPYLKEGENIVKIATVREGDGMAYTEQWYDHNIFE